jgi:hypothetical protein
MHHTMCQACPQVAPSPGNQAGVAAASGATCPCCFTNRPLCCPQHTQGGPGCASLFGAFYELGPELVAEDLSLQPNPGGCFPPRVLVPPSPPGQPPAGSTPA